jgi:hypothetical protein
MMKILLLIQNTNLQIQKFNRNLDKVQDMTNVHE